MFAKFTVTDLVDGTGVVLTLHLLQDEFVRELVLRLTLWQISIGPTATRNKAVKLLGSYFSLSPGPGLVSNFALK